MANGDNKGEIQVIVRTLAGVLVLCIIGDFALIYFGKSIPTELWLLTSNCFTALATMLVKTSPTQATPPPAASTVKIEQPPNEPIPVSETPTP